MIAISTLVSGAPKIWSSPTYTEPGKPKVFGGSPSEVASVNHGTYFFHASQQGLLANDSNIHAGIRTTLSGPSDYENDGYCGFQIVEAREIDTIGTDGIIKKIRDRVGTTNPVYLSLDIDTLDPACKCHNDIIPEAKLTLALQVAPATGTPETGGWSTRELRTILRGLEGINLIGADIVEVAVSCTNTETTTTAVRKLLKLFPWSSLRTIQMQNYQPWLQRMLFTKS